MALNIYSFGSPVLTVRARVVSLPPVNQLDVLGKGVHVEKHFATLVTAEGLDLQMNFVNVVVDGLELVSGEEATVIAALVI